MNWKHEFNAFLGYKLWGDQNEFPFSDDITVKQVNFNSLLWHVSPPWNMTTEGVFPIEEVLLHRFPTTAHFELYYVQIIYHVHLGQ